MFKLLDLFCCAGGAGMGYHQAGFEVTGVDMEPQPNYPFEFIQGDALKYLAEHGHQYDAYHASPPCQGYSVSAAPHRKDHPLLLDETRSLLMQTGKPWVMENVENAPMMREPGLWGVHGIMLCGTSFGLTVEHLGVTYEMRRHRLFESNVLLQGKPCRHRLPVIGIYGNGENKPKPGKNGFQISSEEVRRKLMRMPWASRDEIAQAIPPAYTEWIGRQLMEAMREAA